MPTPSEYSEDLQRAAIEYADWLRDGGLSQNAAHATITALLGVSDGTLREWRRVQEAAPPPPRDDASRLRGDALQGGGRPGPDITTSDAAAQRAGVQLAIGIAIEHLRQVAAELTEPREKPLTAAERERAAKTGGVLTAMLQRALETEHALTMRTMAPAPAVGDAGDDESAGTDAPAPGNVTAFADAAVATVARLKREAAERAGA
jgi:hypothetical protein